MTNNHDQNYDPEFNDSQNQHDNGENKQSQNNELSRFEQNEITPEYEADREIPDLNEREHTQGKKIILYGIVFVIFVVIFFAAVAFAKNYAAYKQQKKAEEAEIAEKKKTNVDFKTDQIEKDKAAIAAVSGVVDQENQYPQMDVGAASEPVVVNAGTQAPNYTAPTDNYQSPKPNYQQTSSGYGASSAPNYSASGSSSVESPKDRKLDGEMMISGSKAATGASSAASLMGGEPQGQNEAFAPNDGGNRGNSNFSRQYQSTAFAATSAMQRSNLSLLLKQGTMIPCVLKTKIVSTYAGQTACQVTKDVYSANGKTLLIERGSSVIGEQAVKVERGSARVFVLWSKLDTPKGVSFSLDSGTVDNLGASGLNAKVNNHFWQRFGGAILLSVIDDALQTVANKNDNSQSGGISYNSTSSSANDVAKTALENTINIPPTATVNQGTLINIFVARDVDFTGVYKLAHR